MTLRDKYYFKLPGFVFIGMGIPPSITIRKVLDYSQNHITIFSA